MILLINGKARSGKDTTADYLVKKLNAQKFWYAKPLKDFTEKYFLFSKDELYGTKTEWSRRVMQGIGSMMRDEIDKNFWVQRVIADITKTYSDKNKHFVISDCRYRNEIFESLCAFDKPALARTLSKYNVEKWEEYKREFQINNSSLLKSIEIPCYTLLITRNNLPKIEFGAEHPSENDLNGFPFDFEISNEGSIDDLYSMIDSVILKMGEKAC